MQQAQQIVADRDLIRLTGHQPNLAGDLEKIEKGLLTAYQDGGLTPPNLKDVLTSLPGNAKQQKEVLEHLVKKGDLVKITTDIYYHRPGLDKLRTMAKEHLQKNGELTTPGL